VLRRLVLVIVINLNLCIFGTTSSRPVLGILGILLDNLHPHELIASLLFLLQEANAQISDPHLHVERDEEEVADPRIQKGRIDEGGNEVVAAIQLGYREEMIEQVQHRARGADAQQGLGRSGRQGRADHVRQQRQQEEQRREEEEVGGIQ